MSTSFACACGKSFQVAEVSYGNRIRCPYCHELVRAEAPPPPPDSADESVRVSEIAASKSSSGLPLRTSWMEESPWTEILKRIPPRPIVLRFVLAFLLVAYVSYQAGRAVQPTSEEPRNNDFDLAQANRPNLSQEAGASTPGPDDQAKTKAPTNDSQSLYVKAPTPPTPVQDSALEKASTLTDIVSELSSISRERSTPKETHPARPVESLREGSSTSTSSSREPAAADIVVRSVVVAAQKSSGEPWDVSDGPPDIEIRIEKTGLFGPSWSSDVYQDSYSATPNAKSIRVAAGDKIRIYVTDKDVFADDKIGFYEKIITESTLRQGTVTWRFDQVQSLTLVFEP